MSYSPQAVLHGWNSESNCSLAVRAENGLGACLPEGPDVAGRNVGVGSEPAVAEPAGIKAPSDVVGDGGPVRRVQSQSSGAGFLPRYRTGTGLGKGRLSPAGARGWGDLCAGVSESLTQLEESSPGVFSGDGFRQGADFPEVSWL